jgi:hypothetical protein
MNSKMRIARLWEKRHSWEVSSIYGTLIFLGLTLYFLIMYAVGAIHVVELRFLNLFIMLAGIYYAVKQYRRTHMGHISYFRALAVGTSTATIASSTFALFLFLFLQFEGNLMESIRVNEQIGRYLNPYIASFAVMLEGIFSGFGLSYLLCNYMVTEKANVPMGGMIPVADADGHHHSGIERS